MPSSHRGEEEVALPILKLRAGRGWMFSATLRPLYPRKRDPVGVIQKAGWALGSFWMGPENLLPPPPSGLEPLSASLYRIRYPGPKFVVKCRLNNATL